MVLTPLASFTISVISWIEVIFVSKIWPIDFLGGAVLFYFFLVVETLVLLRIFRSFIQIKEGVYTYRKHPWICWLWNVHSFLCFTHLFFPYYAGLIPPPLKKFFYRMLGAKMGAGIISIGGRISDPYLVSVEESAMIGDDVLIIPHGFCVIGGEDVLVLGKVEVKKGAVIGARTVLMPGVTIGEKAMVNAMSLVPMNTKIPAGEIWGGVPAQKIRSAESSCAAPLEPLAVGGKRS